MVLMRVHTTIPLEEMVPLVHKVGVPQEMEEVMEMAAQQVVQRMVGPAEPVGVHKELQVLLAEELDKPLTKVDLEALTKPHVVTGQAVAMEASAVAPVPECVPIMKRSAAAAEVILVVVVLVVELDLVVVAEVSTLEPLFQMV